MKYTLIAIALLAINVVCAQAQYKMNLTVYDVVDGFLYPGNKDSSFWRANGEDRMVGTYGYSYTGNYGGRIPELICGIQTVFIDPVSCQWAFVIRREKVKWTPASSFGCDENDRPTEWRPLHQLPDSYASLRGKTIVINNMGKKTYKFYL
ncbi:MAG: hypothetical protein QM802_20160 [Agriterribacter sp.]